MIVKPHVKWYGWPRVAASSAQVQAGVLEMEYSKHLDIGSFETFVTCVDNWYEMIWFKAEGC